MKHQDKNWFVWWIKLSPPLTHSSAARRWSRWWRSLLRPRPLSRRRTHKIWGRTDRDHNYEWNQQWQKQWLLSYFKRTKSLADLAVWLVHGYSITFHIHVRHFPEQWWHHHHLRQSWPISYERIIKDLPRQWEPKSSSSASCISFFWHSMSPSFSFWHTYVFLEGAPQ